MYSEREQPMAATSAQPAQRWTLRRWSLLVAAQNDALHVAQAGSVHAQTCTEVVASLAAVAPPVGLAAVAVACADTELANRIPLRDAAEAPCRYRLRQGGSGGHSRRRRDARTWLQPT